MALSVLDGNQSATTLSTILSGGEHTPAHTVVSLGSQAITDITSAVSGITIAGTVTANVVGLNDNNLPQIFGLIDADGSNDIAQTSAVAATLVDNSGYSIFNNDSGDRGIPIAGRSGGGVNIEYITAENNRLDTNVKNSVTIGSLPNTLSIVNSSSVTKANVQFVALAGARNTSEGASSYTMYPVRVGTNGEVNIDATVNAQSVFSNDGQSHIFAKLTPSSTVTIGSLPAISGTVTAAAPNGALTTAFGSVTTANTAQISAVTNASRKYLLIQNVTTSSNVITVGIGFTPTTTQGIQLTAGAGITFESSYIPTGAVMILSSVTASLFTVLEA